MKNSTFAFISILAATGCHLSPAEESAPAATSTATGTAGAGGAGGSGGSTGDGGAGGSVGATSSSGGSSNTSSNGSSGSSGTSSGSSSSGGGASKTLCFRYQKLAQYDLETVKTHFWTNNADDYCPMNLAGGTNDTYVCAGSFASGTMVVISPEATIDLGGTFYPFDTCAYPGSYCATSNCVPSVGTFTVTLGNCEQNNPTVVWQSNQPHSSATYWEDNLDSLGSCSSNGKFVVP